MLWSMEENIMCIYIYCGHQLRIFFFLFCKLWPNCKKNSKIFVYCSEIVPTLFLILVNRGQVVFISLF